MKNVSSCVKSNPRIFCYFVFEFCDLLHACRVCNVIDLQHNLEFCNELTVTKRHACVIVANLLDDSCARFCVALVIHCEKILVDTVSNAFDLINVARVAAEVINVDPCWVCTVSTLQCCHRAFARKIRQERIQKSLWQISAIDIIF